MAVGRPMRGLPQFVFLLATLGLAACDGDQSPGLRDCYTPVPLPEGGITAVDTSVTPRASPEAEILALEASGRFIAPQDLYERVAHELPVLRSLWPDLTQAQAISCASQLIIGFTDAGAQQAESGQYTAWDDYNATLRAYDLISHGTFWTVRFDGVYNPATVAQEYSRLPELRYVEYDGLIGGSSDVCLERVGRAGKHVYIFWAGSGDCPSGCISNAYRGFMTHLDGTANYLGSYDGAGAAPAWFTTAGQCRNFLYPQP